MNNYIQIANLLPAGLICICGSQGGINIKLRPVALNVTIDWSIGFDFNKPELSRKTG